MSHTTVIILITVIISIAAWQNRRFMGRLIFDPVGVSRFKQYDRFLTHGFVHADAMHLLFNMFTLYFFGRAIERFYLTKLGSLGFVAFYALAIIVAIIPTYWQHKHSTHYLSLGASGGVSAVLFAFVLLSPWSTLYLFAILPIPAIVFALLYTGYGIWAQRQSTGNTNHLAHLTGAAFGVLATLAIEPALFWHFISQLLQPNLISFR